MVAYHRLDRICLVPKLAYEQPSNLVRPRYNLDHLSKQDCLNYLNVLHDFDNDILLYAVVDLYKHLDLHRSYLSYQNHYDYLKAL